MTTSLSVAMVQDNFTVGDIENNADRIISLACDARDEGADIAVFPELALTGYPPEDLLYRESFIAATERALERIISEEIGIDLVIGLPTMTDGSMYNSAVWLQDGEIVTVYDKRHLPNYAVFDEKRYFEPGSQPVVVEKQGIRFGLAICEDIWPQQDESDLDFSEIDCLITINASPYHVGKFDERVEVVRKQAVSLGASLLYVNMVGGQDELVFDGDSLACTSDSEVVLRTSAFEASMPVIEVSELGLATTAPDMPALSQQAAIYKALVLGVRDFVYKNGFSGVVIGLSGGVDSALTLAIAADALGAENVHAVMMPSVYTADISQTDAALEAETLGVQYDVISISDAFDSLRSMLSDVFKGREEDTTEENIQARIRGLLLMAISNKTGRMVLTTSNKSEVAVGYSTLYGDMCGGFAPLKDISKQLVYSLCRYRNEQGDVIPERVLTRPPSAELRPDQTDQDSLPDYDVLDAILERSVEQDESIDSIVADGYERETVERIVRLVRGNEYKRFQAAPGIRITRRAFGRDRRYPITSGFKE